MEYSYPATKERWLILALSTLTNTLVAAAPSMAISVLFKDISTDLGLDLVQVGLIWGIASLPGIVTGLAGGAIGDRFGPRRVLIATCLLTGLFGALRGVASTFGALLAIVFLYGFVSPAITMNTFKTCGMWFPGRQIGLASGVLSMGMAFGFMLGSIVSDTILSPWLGGWRQVFFFYGILAMLLAVPWVISRSQPAPSGSSAHLASPGSLRENLVHVARIRNIWLLGLTILGFGGCIQGTLGYLPLYLRDQGWPAASADGALATFHTISMICVIPIALWSDRLGSRKRVLLVASLMALSGVGWLSIARGPWVWLAVGMAGMVRDGFMAVFMTSILESPGVGPAYAGTAIGMVMIFSGIGSLVAPPLGNSLGSISAGAPFLFWAGLTGLGLVGIILTRERRPHPDLVVERQPTR